MRTSVELAVTIARDPYLVLVVDDDHDLRETLRAILEDEGFATLGASNGQEAMELLRRKGQPRPHVILLDLMMPVMTGFDLFDSIRSDGSLGSIPVVFMTAFRTLVKKVEMRRVLFKPLKIDGVLAAIRRPS